MWRHPGGTRIGVHEAGRTFESIVLDCRWVASPVGTFSTPVATAAVTPRGCLVGLCRRRSVRHTLAEFREA